jgi:ribosomal protein S18 acetylase RimI-like enzyme
MNNFIKNSEFIREIKIETGEILNLIKVKGLQNQLKAFFEKEKELNIALDNEEDNALLSNYEASVEDNYVFYILLKNENLVAFAMANDEETDSLARLYTSVNYRRLGLGSILLKESKKTSLRCFKDNLPALKFYEKKRSKNYVERWR